MARKYAHIKQHEEEIKKMHEEGASYREIGQALPWNSSIAGGFLTKKGL